MNRSTLMILATFLVLTAVVSPARAGSRVDLTPSVAFFHPTADVVDQDGVTARFADATTFGGRLSIWLNDKVMLEGSGHYGRTTLDGTALGQDAGSVDLAIFYGSAQIGVALGEEKRLILHGGLGMQGTNYDEFIEGGNVMTGVLGLSGTMPLGESVSLRTDLDVHAHTSFFEIGGEQTDELAQYDMIFAVGIQFRSGD